MKRKRHNPEQIIRKLREADTMLTVGKSVGQVVQALGITDEYTRECLALEVDRSIPSERVLDILTHLFLTRGVPQHMRSDNGPEFIAKAIQRHAQQVGLEMLYIEPGAPWENGFAESFFSRLRDELLNVEEFMNLAEARWFARRRQQEHNEERPHSSLGYQTPAAFAAGLTKAQARQTGAAPPPFAVTSTSMQRVQAEATAKTDGARHNPLENTTTLTQPELS